MASTRQAEFACAYTTHGSFARRRRRCCCCCCCCCGCCCGGGGGGCPGGDAAAAMGCGRHQLHTIARPRLLRSVKSSRRTRSGPAARPGDDGGGWKTNSGGPRSARPYCARGGTMMFVMNSSKLSRNIVHRPACSLLLLLLPPLPSLPSPPLALASSALSSSPSWNNSMEPSLPMLCCVTHVCEKAKLLSRRFTLFCGAGGSFVHRRRGSLLRRGLRRGYVR